MEFTKIERRREELKAYGNILEHINQELEHELNLVSGQYSWATLEDKERAKIRCEVLNTVIQNLEKEALK